MEPPDASGAPSYVKIGHTLDSGVQDPLLYTPAPVLSAACRPPGRPCQSVLQLCTGCRSSVQPTSCPALMHAPSVRLCPVSFPLDFSHHSRS